MMSQIPADKTATDTTKTPTGNEDSRKLAKDWRAGKGNTKASNFVTPGDLEKTETFDEVMAEKQGESGTTGTYKD